MEFRHRAAEGAPPSQFYPVPPPLPCAPLPPRPPYYGSNLPPPFGATYAPLPPASDHGYFASHAPQARMLDNRPWNGELLTGHDPFLPYQPPRNPLQEREYEKEIIREEILREDTRRRILEEEVRWELEMERRYGPRQPSLGSHGTLPSVQFEQPRYSDGCYMSGSRGQVLRNCFEARNRAGEIPHKIMEINEEELMLKPSVHKHEIKLRNKKKIKKKKNKKAVQKEENGNSIGQRYVHQIMEVNVEELRPQPALLTDWVEPPNRDNINDQEELNPKEAMPEQALPKDKIKHPPNGNNIENEDDGHKVLKPENENKVEQLAFSQSSKELLLEAEGRGSNRKADSISALPSSATTSSSTDKAGRRKAKKHKTYKKEFNCAICHITVVSEGSWLSHLDGKRHRNKLKGPEAQPVINKKENSDIDKKNAPCVELMAVNLEMDKECTPAAEPTREELKTDKQIIQKMQVGHEVHEVVERDNRLWCERCQYSCTTAVMMTIHLVSQKHKANCQKK